MIRPDLEGSHRPKVVVYHSTYDEVPAHLEGLIHNVTPEELYRQLRWCRSHFDLVDAETLLDGPRPGAVAVTFDDGDASVFARALPLLAELGIPATVYLNGATLLGGTFWRDRIRALMKRGLTGDFLRRFPRHAAAIAPQGGSFFLSTKSRLVNSRQLEADLESYSAEVGLPSPPGHSQALGGIRPLKGVRFGNHGYNHYVLSSLTDEEQDREIGSNHDLLSSLGGISRIFAVPFGRGQDYNAHTLQALRKLGYRGFFAEPCPHSPVPGKGLARLERMKAPRGLAAFQDLMGGSREGWAPARIEIPAGISSWAFAREGLRRSTR